MSISTLSGWADAPRTRPAAVPKSASARANGELRMLTELVAETIGRSALASLLGVSASQPTRWIAGDETPSLANAKHIQDLAYVVARGGLVWTRPALGIWLTSHNAFLGGARPLDVVLSDGSQPVVAALDQELSGAYA